MFGLVIAVRMLEIRPTMTPGHAPQSAPTMMVPMESR